MDIKKNLSLPSRENSSVDPQRIRSPRQEERRELSRPSFRFGRYFFVLIIFLLLFLAFYQFYLKGKIRERNYEKGIKNLSAGKFEEATENFQKVSSGENEVDALFKMSVSKYNQKDFEGAIAGYRSVLEKDPQNCQSYNGLGNIYRDQKSYSQAEENYRKAVECDKNFVTAYSNWAIMQSDLGKKDEAGKVIEEALKNNPGNASLLNLKDILLGE